MKLHLFAALTPCAPHKIFTSRPFKKSKMKYQLYCIKLCCAMNKQENIIESKALILKESQFIQF